MGTVHNRLRRNRGNASEYSCIDCGKPGRDWSYIGGDPNEKFDLKIRCKYSTDQNYYVPRCSLCHRESDGWCGEKNPLAKLVAADVIAIRTAYAAGSVSQRELAEHYGIGRTAVGQIVRWKSYTTVGKNS